MIHFIGNDIVLRRYSYTTLGMPYSTFLMNRPLPQGVLRSILLFSHTELPDSQRSLDGHKRCVWLQLFQRMAEPEVHQLKWQQEECLGDNYGTNYTATMHFPVYVGPNYFFGWTCGQMFCPISYSEEPGTRGTLHNIGRYLSTPTVGSFLDFVKEKDFVWSVGVNVESSEIWTPPSSTLRPTTEDDVSGPFTVLVTLPGNNVTANDSAEWATPDGNVSASYQPTSPRATTYISDAVTEGTTTDDDDGADMAVDGPVVVEFDYKPMFMYILAMAVTLAVLSVGSFVLFKFLKERRPKEPQIMSYTPYPPQMTAPQAFYPQQVNRVEKLAMGPGAEQELRGANLPEPNYSVIAQNIQLLPPMVDVHDVTQLQDYE